MAITRTRRAPHYGTPVAWDDPDTLARIARKKRPVRITRTNGTVLTEGTATRYTTGPDRAPWLEVEEETPSDEGRPVQQKLGEGVRVFTT